MQFTHLHVHSHFSLLDGLGKIDELLDAAKAMGMDSLALTDHGAMYGLVEFFQKAKKKGIKPILGCETYVAPFKMTQKRPNIDNKNYHLVLLVKNQEGYENLVKLITGAYLEGFYYKPRVDKEALKKYSQGLIGLSACLAGEIPKAINNGKEESAEKLALEYQKIFGKGNFYLELQHHPSFPKQATANEKIIEIAKKHQIPLVATNDTHYVKSEDAEAQDVLMGISTDRKVGEENRLTMKDDDFSLTPPEVFQKAFKAVPEALENTQEIAQKCNFEFELGKIKLPFFDVPEEETPETYLKQLCSQGLKERFGEKATQESKDRLNYELEIITKTGFASYFLIVQDFVNWAKNNGIVVGPGRGSAAGSLVAYLLKITDVDPLKYNLIFERFLNPSRISMPDIDLDFADENRDKVIDYVSKKYGQNRVAQIITFGTMAARAAIRDAGRAMDYPYSFCDQTAKMIPFGCTLAEALEQVPELKEGYDHNQETKRLIDMSMKLEGCVRHASTHAAAVVITKDDLDTLVPCQHPTQDDQAIVTQYEMHAIEDLGLLKMDFLGLRTLTVIQKALERIHKNHQTQITLSEIPLDDARTYQLFQEGKTTAVFQLESGGMKRHLKELQPTQFEDIIAMVALYRPGPMEFIPEFVARKHGRKEIHYLHPKLEPILKNTQGICIYQEQLMRIAQDLAGFTLPEADVLRKAVGKKIKKLLDEQKEKMISGMVDNNINEKTANQIWQTIEPFARYGFNAAHATCYALIGYQTAYLKAHYPVEFMASVMTSEQDDIERVAFFVDECRQMGIDVLPPDINESEQDFTEKENSQIRFGLNAIKNVGHNVVDAIVIERQKNGTFEDVADFIERVDSKDLNKKSLESLIKCGAMDCFAERNQLLASLEQMLSFARETQKAKKNKQASLFGTMESSVRGPSFKLIQSQPATQKEYLSWEKELLGLYVSEHPLKNHRNHLDPKIVQISELNRNGYSQKVKTAGIINKIKKIYTKKGDPMLFAEIEDETASIEVVVFPSILEKTSPAWQEEKIVAINGKMSDRDEDIKILCDDVKTIE